MIDQKMIATLKQLGKGVTQQIVKMNYNMMILKIV